jgi:hypothetical protein
MRQIFVGKNLSERAESLVTSRNIIHKVLTTDAILGELITLFNVLPS